MDSNTTIIDFIYNRSVTFSTKAYNHVKEQSRKIISTPLKIMALLIAVSGLFAMIFEVRYFSEHSVDVYLTRLSATMVAFLVLVGLYTDFGKKNPILLVHILLLTIIISTGYMIYLLPSTLIINAQIVGLMIFTSALFLSWDIKNQIIVAIYYNIVFASAILMNSKSIYFLPNMYESVLFVLFLSIISVIGSAVNFRLRMMLAEKSFSVLQSEKKYKAIFQNSAEGLFQSNQEGKFIIVNKALVELLGYDSEEDLMKIDITNDLYKYPEERLKLVNELMKNNEVKNAQVILKKKDGTEICIRLNNRLVKDDEGGFYFEGTIQDITQQVKIEKERRIAEKALRAEKAKSDMLAQQATKSSLIKSQFLANMSHEIRTPMNGIIGYLSLLEMEAYEDEKEMNQFVISAKQSAETLLDIINDLLDLSKIEAGKMELDESDFNLSDIIDDSVSMMLTKAREKNLEISKEITRPTPILLKGDSKRMKQIFTNLINNAIKFTEDGSVKINVNGKSFNNGFCRINVSIQDTGIGIQPDKMDMLFKPFSQVDSSSTKKHGGTGLGLVICKEFVKMMKGDIWVESNYEKGTNVNFYVKLKLQDNVVKERDNKPVKNLLTEPDIQVHIPDIKQDGESRRFGFNILLVEDNTVNQKVIIKLLNEAGFKGKVVSNGMEAIEELKAGGFDLVLMDVQMPGMDGYVTTSEIRKLDSEIKNIPIVAITAHALNGDREKCLAAGMNAYITKPIIPEILINTIDKFLNIGKGRELAEDKKDINETNIPEKDSSNSLFDFDHLDKISMGDDDFQKDLISSFLDDSLQRFNRIESYVESGDLQKVINEAHTIKGAGASVGAKKIADEAFALEISAKHKDPEGVLDRVKNLKDSIDRTKELLNSFLLNIGNKDFYN